MSYALAIDGAAVTGWALRDLRTGATRSGTWKYTRKGRDSRGAKFNRFEGHLWEFVEGEHTAGEKIAHVAYEMPGGNFKSRDAGAACYGYAAIIEMVCDVRSIPCTPYAPSAIKRYATGNGNANKEQMLDAAKKHFPGQAIVDHNQADSLWVLELHCDPRREQLLLAMAAAKKSNPSPARRRKSA